MPGAARRANAESLRCRRGQKGNEFAITPALRMTRAFVLSGGASLGAIQAGMLQALFERRVTADLIVGSQAGAINGAFIASREQTVQTAEELGDLWHELRRGVFPSNPLTALIGVMGRGDRAAAQNPLRKVVRRHLQTDRLQDMSVPLHLVATDVLSGEELRLSSGPALDAVMASAAMPGVFAPVQFEGRTLMDGGVSDNTPISHAIELGADEIYVLPTGHACSLREPPRGPLPMLMHATSLLVQQRLLFDIERYSASARLIVLPPPCPQHVEPTDFSQAAELIDRALSDSRAFLRSLDRADRRGSDVTSARLLAPHAHPVT